MVYQGRKVVGRNAREGIARRFAAVSVRSGSGSQWFRFDSGPTSSGSQRFRFTAVLVHSGSGSMGAYRFRFTAVPVHPGFGSKVVGFRGSGPAQSHPDIYCF